MGTNRSGFTIVELLIVIVVIGILTAITIVIYNGLQNRSYESVVQSDLRTVYKKMQVYKINSATQRYPVAIAGSMRDALEPIDIRLTTSAYSTVANSNFTYYESDDVTDFAVMAVVKNGPTYYIKGSDPTVRTYVNSPQYPSGSASVHVAAMGLNASDFDNYAVYVGTGGGWRIWN